MKKHERFLGLYKKGLTLKEIARIFNLTQQAVSYSLRENYENYKIYKRKAKSFNKNCLVCDKNYNTKSEISKFCSRDCAYKSFRLFNVAIADLPKNEYRLYNRERGVKYRKTQNGKISTSKTRLNSIKKNPNAVRARIILNNAVRSNKIKKPDTCSICNKSELRITGHHENYHKPLDVIWVCDLCHKTVFHSK